MTGFEFILYGLLKAAITGAVAGAVLAVVCLNWERIVDWFQSRFALKMSDTNNVGFSFLQRLDSGQHRTVYGIFNNHSKQVLDSQTVNSQQIDSRVGGVHRGHELVIYPD